MIKNFVGNVLIVFRQLFSSGNKKKIFKKRQDFVFGVPENLEEKEKLVEMVLLKYTVTHPMCFLHYGY